MTVRLLDPVLVDFSNLRAAQKAKYFGEFFPAHLPAERSAPYRMFLDFFQTDKGTGTATRSRRYNVNPASLANHMAFRLASEGKDWWGTAHNLQEANVNPFEIAREVLLLNVDLHRINNLDRDLLVRALTAE